MLRTHHLNNGRNSIRLKHQSVIQCPAISISTWFPGASMLRRSRFFSPFAMSAQEGAGAARPLAALPSAFHLNLADTAMRLAKLAGAAYADIRIGHIEEESVWAREERVEGYNSSMTAGFGMRVLLNGSWGFAGSEALSDGEIAAAVAKAIENAQAASRIQSARIVLEDLPAYQDDWSSPVEIDPFAVGADEKAAVLLAMNTAALKAGADYCRSSIMFAREYKFFASSRGSRITQTRTRIDGGFEVTVIDEDTGKFATRASLVPSHAAGWEYIRAQDFAGESALAAEQAHQKLHAKPAVPGKYDLVLDPANLYLTIHETVGHSTELDRALGWEADFAGTTFVTPDKLGKLQFGSPLITIMADRSQAGGLATARYDDDGVHASASEFSIVERGVFKNYQMAIGQAQSIGLERSNGCAYADKPTAFPIQRMPNISLQPNPEPCTLDELFAGIKDGIYIVGTGSWSIDQQRDNFQFGGQLFYEIKDGKRGAMLRDVAYQGRTVEFWNSLDSLCDKSAYELHGTFYCGKAQPVQLAPVSHGSVPARFRQVTVLNTEREDV
jgi:TldD protein